MSFSLIAQLHKKAVAISHACKALGVSRSGYYSGAKASAAPAKVCAASVHLKAAFAASGRTYGSRRLCAALQLKGLLIGRHRVRSLMRANQLRSVWGRKFIHTTDSKHSMPVAPNVLNRQFARHLPTQAWVSDITYVRTRSGWLYLAAVLDLHSRKIVGWAGLWRRRCPPRWCVQRCKWPLRSATPRQALSCIQTGARSTPAKSTKRC